MAHVPAIKSGKFSNKFGRFTHWIIVSSYKNGRNPGWRAFIRPGEILLQSNADTKGEPLVYTLFIREYSDDLTLFISMNGENEYLNVQGQNDNRKIIFKLETTASGIVKNIIKGRVYAEYDLNIPEKTDHYL